MNNTEYAAGKCKSVYTGMSALPDDAAETMAYIPFQLCRDTYEPDTALVQGTLFPVLDKPFLMAAVK